MTEKLKFIESHCVFTLSSYWTVQTLKFHRVYQSDLCVCGLKCLGDDVRRYLSGPPGPQGPPGPPGASGGLSGTYRVEEIATYVFNIMNGKNSSQQKSVTLGGEVNHWGYYDVQRGGLREARQVQEVCRAPLELQAQEALASPPPPSTTRLWSEVRALCQFYASLQTQSGN